MTEQKTVRELSNVKTVKEMKDVLYSKLKDEGCGFNRKDLHLTPTDYGFKLIVEDYETSTFFIHFEYDEYFGYIVQVDCGSEEYPEDYECISFETSHKMIDLHTALMDIGYYVATRF